MPDLLMRDAECLVTMTGDEIVGGWVAVTDGVSPAATVYRKGDVRVCSLGISTHAHLILCSRSVSHAISPSSGVATTQTGRTS